MHNRLTIILKQQVLHAWTPLKGEV